MTSTCRVVDCGAITDGFMCGSCGAELRKAIKDLPGLMHDCSVLATGQTHVYRANRRPVPISAEVARLDEEYAERLALTPPHLRSRDGRGTLPAGPAVVNLAARAQLDAAWGVLTTTVRDLIETRDASNPFAAPQPGPWCVDCGHETCAGIRAARSPNTPGKLADWLADRVNSIRHDEGAADTFAALTTMRARLTRLVDRAPSRIYSGPCDHTSVDAEGRATTCERPLYAWINVWAKQDYDGEDEDLPPIVCDGYRPPSDKAFDPTDKGCGAEHTARDRQAWLFAELEYRLEPITWWSYWLPLVMRGDLRLDVPRGVIESWADEHAGREGRKVRRRLEPRHLTDDAVELFAGGDVMDLMRQYRPRAYAPRPGRRSA